MCGISGIISRNKSLNFLGEISKLMNSSLLRRGPDNNDLYIYEKEGILLNHTRLSINDLTPTGNQPMASNNDRFIIIFNGEIYNHKELRKKLNYKWKGTSDTETLLACITNWGLQKSLENFIGMFAFALLDKKDNKLHLVRDRFGEKPLYWGFAGKDEDFIFGSDLSIFKVYPGFNNEINRYALAKFLNYSYIPSPFSIYKKIWKLEAGKLLTINLPISNNTDFIPKSWWSLEEVIDRGLSNQINDKEEASEEFKQHLTNAINYQSKSDVNVTSFLSGGIDSSLVTCILQSIRSEKINTFTVGFENNKYNEAPFAKAISDFIGTEHNELKFTAQDALEIVPRIPNFFSEPFGDPACIPTYLMCQAARQSGFKVALSGDGADEIFGGYNRYTLSPSIWKKISIFSPKSRRLISTFVEICPDIVFDIFGRFSGIPQFNDRLKKLTYRLNYANSFDELYKLLITEWHDIRSLINTNSIENIKYDELLGVNRNLNRFDIDPVSKMMALDSLSYLTDNNQVKLDRASMASSLETRSPFLDKNLTEFSWKLPIDMKVKGKTGKLILKNLLSNYIPKEMFDRSKSGFATPIKEWLRGPLKEWGNDLLDQSVLNKQNFLSTNLVNQLWMEHISGKKDNSKKLWPILMWQAWLEEN